MLENVWIPETQRLAPELAVDPEGEHKSQNDGEGSMMIQEIGIRDETEADVGVITDVTVAAFATMEISNHTEQFIVEALRAAGALTVSLVAEVGGRVVGHIAFSPVTMSDGTEGWYGLGPVSVLPDYQRRGIGKALIREGLSRLEKLDARGCCLVGHPQYYGRFGFENVTGLGLEGVPQEAFFALSFDGQLPQGRVIFHEGFRADGPQGAATAPSQGDPRFAGGEIEEAR
jgi:putative acetyltransferase